jgi:hypothetical protein
LLCRGEAGTRAAAPTAPGSVVEHHLAVEQDLVAAVADEHVVAGSAAS